MPEPESGKVSFGAWKLEGVPRWSLALATLLVTGIGAWWAIGPTQQQLVTTQEANASLQALVEEMGRHIGEPTEQPLVLMDDARGRLTVARYGRDNCTLLVRTTPDGKPPKTRLIPDLAVDSHAGSLALDDLLWLSVPVSAAGGQCLAYHPGAFKWWQGAKNGCLVDIWRQWPDACQHVVTMDVCEGTAGPIRWTNCVH